MPLKEGDLKDADSYKKASRQDLSKLSSGKAKFWIYKDVELPASGGRKQKYPAFLALVDDNGIRKAMTGKRLICKGTCGMKEARIAFEPATGAVPYKILKVSVPLLLGKPVWIPTGQEEAEPEAEDAAADDTAPTPQAGPPPPPPPPPSPTPKPPSPQQSGTTPGLTSASLSGVWTKLTKDVQAFAAQRPDRKADLFREMSNIGALLKANRAADAKQLMEDMQAFLDSPPPPPKEETSKPGATQPAQLAARWNELLKQLQSTAAAYPARKSELVQAGRGITEMLKARKFDIAARMMDKLDATLGADPREKEYLTRYRAIQGRLAEALKDPERDGGGLRAMSAFITEKAGKGDFDSALKALQRLEQSLAEKPKPATGSGKPGAEQPKAKAEEKETEVDEHEEEEDGEEGKAEAAELQKDLKGRMVSALAQVRARKPREGEKPKPQMQFMAYLAGNITSVIVAKKVGASMKTLLAQIAGVPGGKIARGECIFEENAYTFVLANVPGGLAKKLNKALLAETGARYKVRVRAVDGSGVLDDETDVDPDEAGAHPGAPGSEIPSGIVAKRKFLIERWQKIPPEINANLKALKDAIAREMPGEDAEDLIQSALEYLDNFYDEMKEAIDDDINSGDGEYKGAIDTIRSFRDEIASEPLIQHLKANPLGASVDVESILLDALAEVEKTLAS